jgi:thiamine pyrophosphokinase
MSSSFVILADGNFPFHTHPLTCLQQAATVVCCDGATEKLLQSGQVPDYIVGDLDSLSPELKVRFSDRIFPSDDQETNDLTKAVHFCIERDATKITIVGATGLREDHTLGNISLLADYAALIPDIEMMTDYGIFTVICESCSLESYAGQQISIFALDCNTLISTTDLKYAIVNRSLSSWWQGTLNEALGDSFTIQFDKGRLIVFRCY